LIMGEAPQVLSLTQARERQAIDLTAD
jgi:hypothetical protein